MAASDDAEQDGRAAAGDDYVVVARRYRPQSFGELIGQEHVARGLEQAIRTGRIGHAYLFTGARGVGKTSAARIFAKALNCLEGPTPTPCNRCDVCQRVAAGDDMDVLEIDGASNRGIDEVRLLRQNAGVRPSRSRFKVYIVDEVHMLTKEAFNALLKTLEEPPEHVKFVFATTEPNRIPITILSRCQRFDFAGIETGSIQRRLAQIALAEGVEVEPDALSVIATRAAGSMRDSQSLLEQLLAVADGRVGVDDVNAMLGVAPAARVAELAERVAERDAAAALALVDATLAGGAEPSQLVDQLMGYLRDALALAVGCPAERALYALPAQVDGARALGARLGPPTLLAALQILDQTAARMRVSVHERTLLEVAVVRLATLEDLEDLGRLVAAARDDARAVRSAAPHATPTRRTIAAPAAHTPDDASPRPAIAGSHSPPQREDSPRETPAEVAPPIAAPAPSFPSRDRGGADESDARAAAPVAEAPADQSPAPGDQEPSLADEFARLRASGAPIARAAESPSLARRREQTEAASRPIVQRAAELFGVEPERIRYQPPGPKQG